MVEIKELSFAYGSRQVLRGISFQVQQGEYMSILGANGVGKSTLFRCVLGLLRDYEGQVLIDGQDTRRLSPGQLARLVAYIPQNCAPAFNYSVEDIVLMGTTAGLNPLAVPGRKQMEKVSWALEKLGISHLRSRCFHHISGGERQLAVIARALAQDARVLMLDEPTASLDYGNAMLVLSRARELAGEGYTVIETTHNPEHAFMFCDKVLALKDGAVLCFGSPEDTVTAQTISELYGLEVEMASLYDDSVRVFTPRTSGSAIRQRPCC